MKVLVCGGRDYDDYETLSDVLLQVYKDYCFTSLVHGHAKGADSLAAKWAEENGIPTEGYRANWKTYGKAAGIIRNAEMLDNSGVELVVAFPGGKGTFDMMRRAQRKPNVHLIVVNDSRYNNDMVGESP